MNEDELIEGLRGSIVAYDVEKAKSTANEILRVGIDPLKAIEEGITSAAKTVGEKFERKEYYLPELMVAADAMKAAAEILLSAVGEEEREALEHRGAGTVVLATASGDIHDIGKNIVAMLLSVYGFQVHDLGRDVDSMRIIEKAMEVDADIIGISALMTTTRAAQLEVIDLLRGMGMRDRFSVMVGGGSTNQAWSDTIGADGWAEDAGKAVELAQRLLGGG